MLTADVNVLIHCFRRASPHHQFVFRWFQEEFLGTNEPFTLFDNVMSGFLRVITLPVFDPPTPLGEALDFISAIRNHPHYVTIRPGEKYWDVFTDLCRHTNAKGNLVPDAYLAALAIESGCTWVTMDSDFKRFPGLRLKYLRP